MSLEVLDRTFNQQALHHWDKTYPATRPPRSLTLKETKAELQLQWWKTLNKTIRDVRYPSAHVSSKNGDEEI